jgi:hypothetical protein
MGRMQVFLDMVGRSRLLAPNLKSMTLKLYTGRRHRGNDLARCVLPAVRGLLRRRLDRARDCCRARVAVAGRRRDLCRRGGL